MKFVFGYSEMEMNWEYNWIYCKHSTCRFNSLGRTN